MQPLPDNGCGGRNEKSLFAIARELTDCDQRRAFLDQACARDAAMRRRLDEMLAALPEAEQFFAEGAAALEMPTQVAIAVSEKPGDRIGRYKLLQQIGEGGCGVVYMAEQEEPVRRRVALKVIKLGMDTKSVIARFEAERQALALMDHPNIAKVFDAGAIGDPHSPVSTLHSPLPLGRPYFVMELVRGVRITDYCDQNNLSTRQRLDMFIQVCHAIQHAHQKGVIHRDIKPSNILVTVNDGVPVPKVIDFGIAKATAQQRLTDRTLFTAFEQFIGTPAYMSPEQAAMTSLDIDTRSDIYALGVLLYELLTGQTPFNAKTLLSAGLDGMRRIIREQEPVRPSTLIRQTASAASPSAKPSLAPRPSPLATDLDWIVMKCLEKDRTRRYETANGLAQDIERHLKNEPVAACPPSAVYRARKCIRRNRVMLTEVAMAVCLVVLATAGAALGLRQARVRWARDHAVPEVEALIEQAALTWDYSKNRRALQLVRRASRFLPDGPRLKKAVEACSGCWSIRSDPPGARVMSKPCDDPSADWMALGRTPLENTRLGRGFHLVRFEKPGFESVEAVCGLSGGELPMNLPRTADLQVGTVAGGVVRTVPAGKPAVQVHVRGARPAGPRGLSRRLDPAGKIPSGMIRVAGRNVAIAGIGEVPAFLTDKCEVSHRQFKEFVDAGGYENPQHWKQPFVRNGKVVTWEEAMWLFRDTTGRPGPATWVSGAYPAGRADYPVSGVIWPNG